ncbi:MAG: GNAT family N-acetyltransferase [Pseudomonadota bacterium]
MEIVPATADLARQFVSEIPDLVWATGPVSYEYHFADRTSFDAIVNGSWLQDGSLFGADATCLAIEDGKLMGIEIGMPGAEYRTRQNGLAPVWQALLESGQIDADYLRGVLQRSDHASWLNPVINTDTYYIHALSVKPEYRGKRIGYHLIQHALERAKAGNFAKLQLDVLSDNPAVDFYRAVGLELLAATTAPKPAEFGVPAEYRMGMKV